MLGRRYGTRPPDGYFRELARNPDAFRFTRGRAAGGGAIEALRAPLSGGPAGAGAAGGPALAIGPRGPVVGNYFVPVVLGLFSDSPTLQPYSVAAVQTAYFDAPTGTVSEYYDEVSGGDLALIGVTHNWVTASLTQAAATQNASSLVCCGIGTFIKQVLALQSGVDWGDYDNDGPDGFPNSGDDDGYVDALAVMHPTRGAECPGSGQGGRVWSHKWTLTDASGSGPYVTTSARFGGGVIRIDDYFVQGVVSCDGSSLNEIGVFTHETGHAFGLPDLYDTRQAGARHNGSGSWDLMATGTWGCNGNTPYRPCHMGAWSKAMLGWVTVTTLPPNTDLGTLTLPPVETSAAVYRANTGDGSGEYFLLENRQRIGYDQGLWSEGLLVWQIDPFGLSGRWPSNSVNSSSHMAVWLRQADGLDQLGLTSGGNRGDAGDAFPGQSLNTAFHAGSNPASVSFQGTVTGVTVLDIAQVGDSIDFRAITRFTRLTVTAPGTVSGSGGLFRVDGSLVAGPPANFVVSAPYAVRTLEAAVGAPAQSGGWRMFERWTDAPAEPRSRVIMTPIADTEYVAEYGVPSIPFAQLASPFLLSGAALGPLMDAFLDLQGNNSGSFDLGDFRAWVLAHPSLPLSADLGPAAAPQTVVLPLRLEKRSEDR